MRSLLLSLFLSIFFLPLWADEVPQDAARSIAANFYRIQQGQAPDFLTLVQADEYDDRAVFYVYQINAADGFVIVSGDDQVFPILGYSLKGQYVVDDQAPQVSSWLEKYHNEIVYIINEDAPATPEISEAWTKFRSLTTPSNVLRNTVGPLLQVGWDQAPYYNADCPFNNQYNERTVTGCVATAMAMVMKYWSYPAQGSGFHSYDTQTYGTLSANFGSSNYNWAAMPNQISGPNTEIAKLMSDCGVSVEMTYGVGQTGGSSAYVVSVASPIQHCAEYAYKTYFGYDASTLIGVMRQTQTDQQWIATLKGELDAGRVMQYAGIGSGGGHTWVCDGYDDNNFFHMNWGWSNQNNGFFNLDALNPSSLGTGGGDGGFNSNQQVVKGIKPPGGTTPPPPASLSITSGISINPGFQIDFNSAFDVYATIGNTGSTSITADFAAALVTTDGYLVDFVQTFTNQTIAAGTSVNATFSTTGLLATPGNYLVAVVFKQGAGNWQLIDAGSGAINPYPVTILGPYNYIQLYSNMTLNPTQFVSGQAASVNVNLINEGFNDWYGVYACALYDLEGNYVTTIGSLNENNGLPYGYSYLSPYLTFSTTNLAVDPGTYILAMLGEETGTGQYYLLGGSYYTNPITITIVAPPLSPDQYENNNTTGSAFPFTPTFSGSSTSVLTTGSNFHLGSDIDYYEMSFPAGYNYLITPRLHDSYNSGNGNTYTVDGVFSYDAGSGSSPAIDDIAPEAISLSNGGYVQFKVSPYFSGNTGSYLLDVQISRSIVGIEDASTSEFQVYPNPAKDFVWVSLPGGMKDGKIELMNELGQLVKSEKVNGSSSSVQINTSSIDAGIYLVRYTNDKQTITRKLSIHK
jgi:hypothetical protein